MSVILAMCQRMVGYRWPETFSRTSTANTVPAELEDVSAMIERARSGHARTLRPKMALRLAKRQHRPGLVRVDRITAKRPGNDAADLPVLPIHGSAVGGLATLKCAVGAQRPIAVLRERLRFATRGSRRCQPYGSSQRRQETVSQNDPPHRPKAIRH